MGKMDEFKKEFENEHKVKWEYSNPKNMEKYLTFKNAKDEGHFAELGNDEDGKPYGRGRPQWALDMVQEFEEENALHG